MLARSPALKWLSASLLSALLLVLFAWAAPSGAQFGGGMGLGQQEIVRQMQDTAKAMTAYRRMHDHYPQMTQEIDDALKFIFGKVSLSPADPFITPQSLNAYRTYYQFAMAYDPSISGLAVVNGQVMVPNYWSAPPNTIVVLVDGGNKYVVWAAATDQKPMLDPNTSAPMIIYNTVDTTPH